MRKLITILAIVPIVFMTLPAMAANAVTLKSGYRITSSPSEFGAAKKGSLPLEERVQVKKKATMRAAKKEPGSPPASPSTYAAGYEPYTPDECRKAIGDQAGVTKKHNFAYCAVYGGEVYYESCEVNNPTECEVVGSNPHRITVLGEAKRDNESATFTVYIDKWSSVGVTEPSKATIDITYRCHGYGQDSSLETCKGYEDGKWQSGTVETWMNERNNKPYSWTFDTSSYPGDNITENNPLDKVHHHDANLRLGLANNIGKATISDFPTEEFRCDKANYHNNITGPACIFDDQESIWKINANWPQVSEVGQHILDAQNDPGQSTKPEGAGVKIPGGLDSGKALTRNYYDKTLRKRNHAVAVANCRKYWGEDYTEGGTKDCDEYPFASTYEGAATTGIGSAWFYSSRPVDASQNRAAGAMLLDWMNRDHLLDSDPYWVEVYD